MPDSHHGRLGSFRTAENYAKDIRLMEFYLTLRRSIDQNSYALTIRQLAVLLTCYMFDEDHTLTGLATRLRVAKPTLSRMLDRLAEGGLIERRADPRDRRYVLFERTYAGKQFLERIRQPVPSPRKRSRRQSK
jgi:DNA-binding MarR family transcriptional regulator